MQQRRVLERRGLSKELLNRGHLHESQSELIEQAQSDLDLFGDCSRHSKGFSALGFSTE